MSWTLAQLAALPKPAPAPDPVAAGSLERVVLDALERHGPLSAYALHRLLYVFDVRQIRNALYRMQTKGLLHVRYQRMPSAVGRVVHSVYTIDQRKHPR